MNQIHAMLVTAPAPLREKYRPLSDKKLIDALATCRPATQHGVVRAVLTALKMLAQRHRFLTGQTRELHAQLRDLVTDTNLGTAVSQGRRPRHRRSTAGHRRRTP